MSPEDLRSAGDGGLPKSPEKCTSGLSIVRQRSRWIGQLMMIGAAWKFLERQAIEVSRSAFFASTEFLDGFVALQQANERAPHKLFSSAGKRYGLLGVQSFWSPRPVRHFASSVVTFLCLRK